MNNKCFKLSLNRFKWGCSLVNYRFKEKLKDLVNYQLVVR